jgi:acyl-coenzyme A thioesterase PaaI-like protein
MDEHAHALAAAARAAREVNRQIRITDVDADCLAQATALLDEASRLLATSGHPGPHAQTGHGAIALTPSDRPADFFPYSPVVGPLNPIAPPVDLQIDDGEVSGTVTLTEQYNGPPWDLTHGGVVALVFDELLGVAGIAGAGGGFTGRLTVRYHKPTPILQELRLHAAVTSVRGRKITVKGTMHHGDLLTAEAEGLFVSLGGVLSDAL